MEIAEIVIMKYIISRSICGGVYDQFQVCHWCMCLEGVGLGESKHDKVAAAAVWRWYGGVRAKVARWWLKK